MTELVVVLLLIAGVLFALAAVGVVSGRFNLMAAGLCFLTIAFLVPPLNVLF